jgi:endonuclease-3
VVHRFDTLRARIKFLEDLSEQFPDARVELEHDDPFTLLVAVVLAALTSDRMVNKTLPILFADGSTAEALCALGADGIDERIKSIYLHKKKAGAIHEIAQTVVRLGRVPDTLEELVALPGVGRKTANVILLAAFKKPAYPVDRHVFRVCNCTGLATGSTPYRVECALKERIPEEHAFLLYGLLVRYGQHACRPGCDGGCIERFYAQQPTSKIADK